MDSVKIGAPRDHQNANPIKNLPVPQDPGDAANKDYVDNTETRLSELVNSISVLTKVTIRTDSQAFTDSSSTVLPVAGLVNGKIAIEQVQVFLLCLQSEGGYLPGDIITPASKLGIELLDTGVAVHPGTGGIRYISKVTPRGELVCTDNFWEIYAIVTFMPTPASTP